jgi:hypothetical protein
LTQRAKLVLLGEQAESMKAALDNHGGVDVLQHTRHGSEHFFNQWQTFNSVTQECVGTDVLDFLNAHKTIHNIRK